MPMTNAKRTNTKAASDEVVEAADLKKPEVVTVATEEEAVAPTAIDEKEPIEPVVIAKDPADVEVTATASGSEEAAPAPKKGKATVANVKSSFGIVRTYSLEEHGKDFADLAQEYANDRGYLVDLA